MLKNNVFTYFAARTVNIKFFFLFIHVRHSLVPGGLFKKGFKRVRYTRLSSGVIAFDRHVGVRVPWNYGFRWEIKERTTCKSDRRRVVIVTIGRQLGPKGRDLVRGRCAIDEEIDRLTSRTVRWFFGGTVRVGSWHCGPVRRVRERGTFSTHNEYTGCPAALRRVRRLLSCFYYFSRVFFSKLTIIVPCHVKNVLFYFFVFIIWIWTF